MLSDAFESWASVCTPTCFQHRHMYCGCVRKIKGCCLLRMQFVLRMDWFTSKYASAEMTEIIFSNRINDLGGSNWLSCMLYLKGESKTKSLSMNVKCSSSFWCKSWKSRPMIYCRMIGWKSKSSRMYRNRFLFVLCLSDFLWTTEHAANIAHKCTKAVDEEIMFSHTA